MFTTLGKPAQAPRDAVDLLLECHDRIRSFTSLARRLASSSGLDDREVAEAAERVRRYFAEALPLHAADEEQSIVPRLRGRDPAVDRELAEMQREHVEHGELVGRVVALSAALAEAPARLGDLAGPLGAAAAALERHFEEHLGREERVLFPALRRALGAAELAAIGHELRARRGGGAGGAPPAP